METPSECWRRYRAGWVYVFPGVGETYITPRSHEGYALKSAYPSWSAVGYR